MGNNRIKALDGLRALAAFGVVWIHCWSFYKNPALPFAGIDLYKAAAILGNGVDFSLLSVAFVCI
jgi:peptidoglycan/LPS O-acetylase OafA/YrhL